MKNIMKYHWLLLLTVILTGCVSTGSGVGSNRTRKVMNNFKEKAEIARGNFDNLNFEIQNMHDTRLAMDYFGKDLVQLGVAPFRIKVRNNNDVGYLIYCYESKLDCDQKNNLNSMIVHQVMDLIGDSVDGNELTNFITMGLVGAAGLSSTEKALKVVGNDKKEQFIIDNKFEPVVFLSPGEEREGIIFFDLAKRKTQRKGSVIKEPTNLKMRILYGVDGGIKKEGRINIS